MKALLFSVLALGLTSCVVPQKADKEKNQDRVDYLSRLVREQSQQMEQLKSENELLQAQQIKRQKSLGKMVVGKTTKTAEQLYTDAIRAFRGRKIAKLIRAQKLLLKNHPSSEYNDNALYLVGRLNLLQGNYSQSLKYFDYVVKLYPKSSKRVSSLFYKGVAYRKLRLDVPARKLFDEVNKTYPGSPEARRTKMELRLLDIQTKS